MRRVRLEGADATLLAGVAIARGAFLLATWNDPVFRVPYLDGAFYDTWARSLAAGHGDFQGPYFLGPLYPYFVALLYRLGGADVHVVRVAQTGLGFLSAVLVWSLGRTLFGRAAGRAALVCFALYGPLVFYENLLVMESLLVALTLGAWWVLCVPAERPGLRAPVAGALLGLASLGRPTVLLTLPVVCWVLARPLAQQGERNGAAPVTKSIHGQRGSNFRISRSGWQAIGAAAFAWFLVLLPALVRNARLGAGPVIATNGGINFYAGNHSGAVGRFRAPEGIRFFSAPVFEAAGREPLPPAVAARALTVEAVAGDARAADSRYWLDRAWRWTRSEPLVAAALPWRRLWLVLQAREIPQIESYSFHARRLSPLGAFAVDFGVLWPLAALGLWQARRARLPGWGRVAAYAVALLMPCLLFFVTARYRLAVVPYASLFAGLGLATLFAWGRRRAWRHVALGILGLAPIAIASRLGAQPPRGAAAWEAAQMAERLYALGDLEGAIAWQGRAAAQLPDRYEVQLGLALYWSERRAAGDIERAERLLESLARRWPAEPIVWFNWGSVLADEGRIAEARAAWERCLELDPTFEPARSRLLQSR